MNEPTPEELQQLTALVQEASSTGFSASAMSGQRVKLCVDIGRTLNGWKERMPHGQWMRWTSEHLPSDLSKATRERWMALADRCDTGRLDISTARGLRQAYEMAGLLPDRQSAGTKASTTEPSYLTHLTRLLVVLGGIEVDALTDGERITMKARLDPILIFVRKL